MLEFVFFVLWLFGLVAAAYCLAVFDTLGYLSQNLPGFTEQLRAHHYANLQKRRWTFPATAPGRTPGCFNQKG